MAQIFKPTANSLARASLVGAVSAPLVIGVGIAMASRSPLNTKVDVPKNQPVPFSHQHHVAELGLDCRYCHTSVEKSASAGIPPTETCMSCHSQIWTNSPLLQPIRDSYETNTPIEWVRVNKAPEFVYFNHSIHVNRGINCNNCHGAVQEMHITWKGNSFQMAWCLECHRAPEKYLYKDKAPENKNHTGRQQVFDLYWKIQTNADLDSRELGLARGESQKTEDKEEVEKGKELINTLSVRKQQLADCWICHR